MPLLRITLRKDVALQHLCNSPISRHRVLFALLIVLICAASFRFYGLCWDGYFGAYPHPDERHLANTMSRLSLPWPLNWAQLMDPATSPLNPRRVNPADGSHYDLAYGTLPLYIYKAVAAISQELGYPSLNTYDGYFLVGRVVTVIFALITVGLTYATGAAIYGPSVGLLGAAFLACSVTHIQLSHFMTVDLALTMFIIGGLYWGLRFARRGGWSNALLLGLSLGGATACKVSGATLLAAVSAAYVFWAFGPAVRTTGRPWIKAVGYLLLTILGFLLLFGTFEFYVLLDPRTYIGALSRQAQMVQGTNDWPFTRQYVNTTLYLYHLENLVRWGLGWPLGVASLGAVLVAAGRIVAAIVSRRTPDGGAPPDERWWQRVVRVFFQDLALWGAALVLAWSVSYFIYVGRYEVKFMRYMLPLVPPLCVLAGWLTITLARHAGRLARRLSLSHWGQWHLHGNVVGHGDQPAWPVIVAQMGVVAAILLPTVVWAMAFLSIYQRPHTWLDASRWLYADAPRGAAVSSEAWDDALPVDITSEGHTRSYFAPNVTMDIYHDMSPEDKFRHFIQAMRRSDYIVLATPRLYGAVRRLPWRYPVEIKYYELLFSGKLGFELAYVSMSYPSIWGFTFVDDPDAERGADESFSVYDHPKVLIYRKVRDLPEAELRNLFGDALIAKPVVTRRGSTPPVNLPTPRYRKTLMLGVPVDALPPVNDYAWNRWASSGTGPSVLVWLLVLAIVSLAVLPLSWALFRSFADRGYLLAKPLGLLLVAYLTWMPVSLGFWHYTVWAVIAAVAFVGFLSHVVILSGRRREPWRSFWQRERRLILRCELVFLAAFLFSLLLRLGNPDLWHPINGGEKPMEFGFLNAILRSPTMPPYDPFFSGGYVNYYYYGLFLVSTLVKLTGLAPAVAFNLIIPTLFALTVSGAYAVVATLTGRHVFGWIGGALTAFIGPLSGAVTIRGRGGFGEVVAALQRLADPQTQGSLARTWQGLWRWLGPEILPLRTDWFWDASRTHGPYENTITEFPFWSFLFADLHPHTINIPFTILAIALSLRLAQGLVRHEGAAEADRSTPLAPWLLFIVIAVVLGALAVTNSWDFPTFLLLATGSLALAHLRRARRHWLAIWRTLAAAILGAVLLAPLSLGLYFPFFTHFQAFVKGIGRVKYPTEFNYYLGFFGFFLFLIASYGLWCAVRRMQESRTMRETGAGAVSTLEAPAAQAPLPTQLPLEPLLETPPAESVVTTVREPHANSGPQAMVEEALPLLVEEAQKEIAATMPPVSPPPSPPAFPPETPQSMEFSTTTTQERAIEGEKKTVGWAPFFVRNWLLVAAGVLFVLIPLVARQLYPRLNWRQVSTWWLISELLLLVVAALWRREASPEEGFANWLALVGLLVSLGVEVVYIRDHLGDTWYRMNTIFKFYTHTWVVLAVAAAACLGYLWKGRRLLEQQPLAVFWWTGFGILTLAVALYPIFAIQSRWRDRFPSPPAWGTLDGLAYMETGVYHWEGHQIFLEPDYKAIRWLMDNLKGTPVIAQAPYGFYRENGVRIAVNTGYPTVLNPLHENEQRYDELIGPRHRDADNLYKTTDVSEAAQLLARYGVGYVYVGPFEQAVYPSAGLDKFDAMLEQYLDLVYDEDSVRIYRVRQETRRLYGGPISETAKPVAIPTIQPRPAATVDRDALKNLERAANASPDNPGLQFELGDRYRQMDRLEDAVRVFERSLKYHPEDVAMYHTLGDTYTLMNKPEEALKQYIRATEAAPNNPAAFNKLGVAYLQRERLAEAVDAFQQAIRKDPKFVEAYFHLGEAYERQGNKTAAREAYANAQQRGPGTDWEIRASERLRALEQ